MMPARRGFEYASSDVFHHAFARAQQHVATFVEVAHRQQRLHALWAELQQVDDRLAAGRAREIGHLEDLQPVDASAVGEEEHVSVRRRHEQVLDEIFLLRLRRLDALATALLRPIRRRRRALHVARVGHGDDHVLLDDQILGREAVDGAAQLRAPFVPEALFHLAQFVDDDVEDALVTGEQGFEVGGRRATRRVRRARAGVRAQ